jgi:hypothetical protein
MDISEPEIKHEDILILEDDHFNTNNVCIVTGSGTGKPIDDRGVGR